MREYLNHLSLELRAAGFPRGADSHEDHRVRIYDLEDVHVAVNTETGHTTIARVPDDARDVCWAIDYGNPYPVLTGAARAGWNTQCDPDTPASIVLAVVREAHTLRRFEATPRETAEQITALTAHLTTQTIPASDRAAVLRQIAEIQQHLLDVLVALTLAVADEHHGTTADEVVTAADEAGCLAGHSRDACETAALAAEELALTGGEK